MTSRNFQQNPFFYIFNSHFPQVFSFMERLTSFELVPNKYYAFYLTTILECQRTTCISKELNKQLNNLEIYQVLLS